MPTFTQDLDIWQLILHASVVVKVVMAILVAVSFMSWMFIFQKWFVIRRAVSQTLGFEREFWGGQDLNALYQGAVNHRHSIGSLERVFEAGYREFAKLRSQAGTEVSDMVDGARRAMRATFQREMDFLERHLAFLASTGSVSPYIGLFGTVWGIMHAFRRRGPMHEINIVPYVDVMLVLLVIFMVTAPLITPAVIDLPSVEKAGQPRVVPLEVFVKADRGLVVRSRDASGRILDERSISRGELAKFLKSARSKNEDLSVLVGGDKNARYEAVLQVMDELRKQGVSRVGLQ